MKLKHQGGNKTDREKLAKSIVLNFANNKPFPVVTLNLPPGAIEEEARKLNMSLPQDIAKEMYQAAASKFQERLNKI